MTRRFHDLPVAFARVFASPAYVALAVAVALPTFVLAIWLPNFGLIAQVWSDSRMPPTAALVFAMSLLGGIGTNFSLLAAAYTIAIAILFGLTVAMIVYSIRHRQAAAAGRGIAIGSGAMASGVIGVGCAACGSLLLGMVLPSLSAAGALAALPLNGEEFGLLSVALLFLALALVSSNVAQASTCTLDRGANAQEPWTIRR